MIGIHHQRGVRRHAMMALLALALAVRFIVPQGWMPSQVAGQVITICTGADGMTKMVLGKDGKLRSMPKSDHDKTEKPCAFAAMAIAASLPDAATGDIAPMAAEQVAASSQPTVSIGKGLAAPPPPATGPPILI